MYLDPEFGDAMASWDRVMHALSAGPRRQLIVALLDAPPERQLPLPDTALVPAVSQDPSSFSIELRHSHLPHLADAGYIRWSDDPFAVQRGPRFDEPAAVVRLLLQGRRDLPASLWNDAIESNLPDRL